MRALSIIARALGVTEATGCHCALCGASRFDAAGRTQQILGRNFTDHEYVDPTAGEVCKGCQRLLGGRPGDDPPPLRTVSFLASAAGFEVLDREAWWALLSGERSPDHRSVLSWATSRKRHHWLRAGLTTPLRWEVGCDDGRISWEFSPDLPSAVAKLLTAGASKGAILAGRYPPRLLSEHTACVQESERVLTRYRGQLILDLVVWAAPRDETRAQPEETIMLDDTDRRAAGLLGDIVWGSQLRAEEGIQFWGGFLLRRLRRFARLPLGTLISRLLSECRVGVSEAAHVTEQLAALSAEETHAVECAIRERPDLIHALAFQRVQTIRDERKARGKAPKLPLDAKTGVF